MGKPHRAWVSAWVGVHGMVYGDGDCSVVVVCSGVNGSVHGA